MISSDSLTSAALAILETRHDRDVIEKLTPVLRYSELLDPDSNNASSSIDYG
jgi:hypothetical protein